MPGEKDQKLLSVSEMEASEQAAAAQARQELSSRESLQQNEADRNVRIGNDHYARHREARACASIATSQLLDHVLLPSNTRLPSLLQLCLLAKKHLAPRITQHLPV